MRTTGVKADVCTRDTPRCSDARSYDVELRECCRAHVRKIMADLVRLLDGAGVRWFADYGTLLGAVRNEQTTWADYPWLPQEGRETAGPAAGIVPHDKDGDIGVLWSDWQKLQRIRQELVKLGYSVSANYSRGSMKVKLSGSNHTNVDIFFWRERPDGMMYRAGYAQVDQCKGREFPKRMLNPPSQVMWEGLTLPAPADPDEFLEMRYGPNWRTPIPANNDGVRR